MSLQDWLDFAKELRAEVVEKLKAKYPDLGLAVEDPPE